MRVEGMQLKNVLKLPKVLRLEPIIKFAARRPSFVTSTNSGFGEQIVGWHARDKKVQDIGDRQRRKRKIGQRRGGRRGHRHLTHVGKGKGD